MVAKLSVSERFIPPPEPFVRGRWLLPRFTLADARADSGEKLVEYARAGVVQYVIINLRNRTAEVYVDPDQTLGTFASPTIVTDQGVLSLRVGDDEYFAVPLVRILP